MGEEFRSVAGNKASLYIEGVKVEYSSLTISYGAGGVIPELIATIPASSSKVVRGNKKIGWRSLRPRTKVLVLVKDENWGEVPRFTVFFEGEIIGTGFSRVKGDRNFNVRALHITNNFEGARLASISAGQGIREIISGENQESATVVQELGDMYMNFTPAILEKVFGVSLKEIDIYSFAKYAIKQFQRLVKSSNIKGIYPMRAIEEYKLGERLYDPHINPSTGLKDPNYKDSTFKGKWTTIYNQILSSQITGLLPKLGERMNFLEMIRVLMQIFLHEFSILPNPKTFRNTLMVKPSNVFMEVPSCNVLYPILSGSYSFMDNWYSKPTRLIQISDPPLPASREVIRKYVRNVAPGALAQKFDEYEKLDPKDRPTFDLFTEEERERGLVESYNDIPSFLTTVFQVIRNGNEDVKIDSDLTIKGFGFDAKAEESNFSTIPEELTGSASEEDSAFKKLFLHKQFLLLENIPLSESNIRSSGKPVIRGSYKFKPKRITIIPSGLGLTGPSYSIQDGKLFRKRGRFFNLFEEPINSLPLYLKTDYSLEEIQKLHPDHPLSIRIVDSLAKPLSVSPMSREEESIPPLEEAVKSVGGGSHYNLVVEIDLDSPSFLQANKDVLNKLCALTSLFCEIPSQNISYLGDFETLPADLVNKETELKTSLSIGIETEKANFERMAELENSKRKGVTITTQKSTASSPSTSPSSLISSYLSETEGSAISANLQPSLKPEQVKIEKEQIKQANPSSPLSSTHQRMVQMAKAIYPGRENLFVSEIRDATRGSILSPEELMAYLLSKTNLITNFGISEALEKEFSGTSPQTQKWRYYIKNFSNSLKKISNSLDLLATKFPKIYGGILSNVGEKKALIWYIGELSYKKGTREAINSYVRAVGEAGPVLGRENSYSFSDLKEAKKIDEEALGALKRFLSLLLDKDSSETDTEIKSIYPEVAWQSDPYYSLASLIDFSLISRFTSEILWKEDPEKEVSDKEEEAKTQETNGYKNIYDQYCQPVAEYYFYLNRYSQSSLELNIAFNPYLTPGYSAILIDNSEMQYHLRGYVVSVSHTFSPYGISTNVVLQYIRKEDINTIVELQETASESKLLGGAYPRTIQEMLNGRIPFFEGEYSSSEVDEEGLTPIQKTFQKTIGCGVWDGNLDPELLNNTDYLKVMENVRRGIQCAKVENIPEEKISEKVALNNAAYENPSDIYFDWQNGDFPDTIKSKTVKFNSSLQEFLLYTLTVVRGRGSQKG